MLSDRFFSIASASSSALRAWILASAASRGACLFTQSLLGTRLGGARLGVVFLDGRAAVGLSRPAWPCVVASAFSAAAFSCLARLISIARRGRSKRGGPRRRFVQSPPTCGAAFLAAVALASALSDAADCRMPRIRKRLHQSKTSSAPAWPARPQRPRSPPAVAQPCSAAMPATSAGSFDILGREGLLTRRLRRRKRGCRRLLGFSRVGNRFFRRCLAGSKLRGKAVCGLQGDVGLVHRRAFALCTCSSCCTAAVCLADACLGRRKLGSHGGQSRIHRIDRILKRDELLSERISLRRRSRQGPLGRLDPARDRGRVNAQIGQPPAVLRVPDPDLASPVGGE